MRPKIYHLLANQEKLAMDNGDRINELKLLKALSRFADVYYNDQKFEPETPNFGLGPKAVKVPAAPYSLHYVRNNIEIFRELPGPKVWMAYPYSEEAFANADAVLTTTEVWKTRLEGYNDDPEAEDYFNYWYPKKIVPPKRVINIRQIIDPSFYSRKGHFKSFEYRAKFNFGFVIGYFGRLENQTFPYLFFEALPRLKKEFPHISVVFAGKLKDPLPSPLARYVGRLSYEEVPYAVSACDVVLCNEESQADWLGAGKVLDAMACGVPPVTIKHTARTEQLGDDYPLFYKDSEEVYQVLRRLILEKAFHQEMCEHVKSRANHFSLESAAAHLEKSLAPIFEGATLGH